jgi:hypothetical protein
MGKELDGPAVSTFSVRLRKLSHVGLSSDGWPKNYYLELLRASEGMLSRWSWLQLQSHQSALRPRGRLSPFSLCVIHEEGLCLSFGDINRLMQRFKFSGLMMIMNMCIITKVHNEDVICQFKYDLTVYIAVHNFNRYFVYVDNIRLIQCT